MSCISFAHRPIARIGEFAAAVARLDVEDTPKVGIDRLQAPEAAAGQSGEFETSLGYRRPRAQNSGSDRRCAPARMGGTHYRCFDDAGMLTQHVFDFGRIDILAPRYDEICGTTYDLV